MQIEPEVSFQNVEHSAAVEQNIRERIGQLEQFHPHLIACRVVVDAPHHDKNKGNLYEIRIDMSVPGDDLAVSRHTGINHAHEDIYVAIRDAFDAARRLLEDRSRQMDAYRTKRHPEVQHGKVVRLFADDGYGFIETPDGREVYFQRDSLTGEFWNRLKVGSNLRFKEMEGDKGPFGVSVTLMD
jgi:ribosome-associated translation inhibitor RaiA